MNKGILDLSPRLGGIPRKEMGGGKSQRLTELPWKRGFWTAEDHCKHALVVAAVTCAGQVRRHPIPVGRGSCGPTLAEDSCQLKESWCSSEVPTILGRRTIKNA